MTACEETRRLLVRIVDDQAAPPLTVAEQAQLDAHLDACAGCREALAGQREVAVTLRGRPALAPSTAFAANLAARLDNVSGWLGMLDWRVWTFRLAPVALALALAALLTGTSSATDASAATLDTWTRGVSDSASAASAVWQDATSPDALLETMLTGASDAGREAPDVR